MHHHFNFLSYLTADENWQKFSLALILGVVLVVLTFKFLTSLNTDEKVKAAVVPSKRISLFGLFDFIVESFVKLHDSVLTKENRKFLPFSGTVFLFVFFSNLLGLIPGMPALTTTVWVNVGISMLVFLYFNYQGIRSHGLVKYLKHFCGPVWWLAWLILPIELLSTSLRILTLNLRLYWNITADHLVLGVFTDLVPLVVPVAFYALGTFVAFMQAFVFCMLTMVYVLLATQHAEEH